MPKTAKEVMPDALLTNTVIEYGKGGPFVYNRIFPEVSVKAELYKYAEYGRENVSDDMESRIAVGPNEANLIDFSLAWKEASCDKHALKNYLDDRVLNQAANPERLRRRRAIMIDDKISLKLEKGVRDAITDTAAINNATPAVKWNAANAEIEADVDAAKEAFVKQSGYEPTHIIIPPTVSPAMKRDSKIRELVKYTKGDLLVNGDLPPTLWNMQVIIPGSLVNSAAPGAAANIARIWSADKVVLAYIDPNAQDTETFTAGVTVMATTLTGGVHTMVEAWREKGKHGEYFQVSKMRKPQLLAAAALYIINDVLV